MAERVRGVERIVNREVDRGIERLKRRFCVDRQLRRRRGRVGGERMTWHQSIGRQKA
jgi:hypothetical protein